jgi:hypothetical protein
MPNNNEMLAIRASLMNLRIRPAWSSSRKPIIGMVLLVVSFQHVERDESSQAACSG